MDCRVVGEYICPVFTSDESVALGAVEKLNSSFALCHKLCLRNLKFLHQGSPISIATLLNGLLHRVPVTQD